MNCLESLITLQFIFYLPRYFQNENINTFKNISAPNNLIYKRIFKFINTHYWAIEDNFTKCKKTITALRDLASLAELPLVLKEKRAIRWAVYQLSSMLMLPMLQICRAEHRTLTG